MAGKTNKSFTKRLKASKNGKLSSRKIGQNHFNAKTSGRGNLKKSRSVAFHMTKKQQTFYFN